MRAIVGDHGLDLHELPDAVLLDSPGHPHTGYIHISRDTGQVTHLRPRHLGYFTLYPDPTGPGTPPVTLEAITAALTRHPADPGDPGDPGDPQ